MFFFQGNLLGKDMRWDKGCFCSSGGFTFAQKLRFKELKCSKILMCKSNTKQLKRLNNA